jgi:hypothetical protein
VEGERKLGSTIHGEKNGKGGGGGGARGSAHRGGDHDGGGGRTAAVVRSDSDVVAFGHGRQRDRDGRARGEATARLGQRRGAVRSALPIGAFMAWRRAWQPRGDGVPTVGPARETAADRWAPHVSDFCIKNYPRMKIAQNK